MGYCTTSQGSLDWVEVDLSVHPASSCRMICSRKENILCTSFVPETYYASVCLNWAGHRQKDSTRIGVSRAICAITKLYWFVMPQTKICVLIPAMAENASLHPLSFRKYFLKYIFIPTSFRKYFLRQTEIRVLFYIIVPTAISEIQLPYVGKNCGFRRKSGWRIVSKYDVESVALLSRKVAYIYIYIYICVYIYVYKYVNMYTYI